MKFYVYTHRRPDKDVIFYVGRGQMYDGGRCIYPRRAHAEHKRNDIWKRIVKKNNGIFFVEVDYWYDTFDEASAKEMELIKLHGKIIDKKGGTLSNITDGGDGSIGTKHSEVTKAKMKIIRDANPSFSAHFKTEEFKKDRLEKIKLLNLPPSMLGKKHKDSTKVLMSEAKKGSKHYAARDVLNCWSGEKFGCVEDAAKSIGLNKWTLYKALSGERQNYTIMRYVDGV